MISKSQITVFWISQCWSRKLQKVEHAGWKGLSQRLTVGKEHRWDIQRQLVRFGCEGSRKIGKQEHDSQSWWRQEPREMKSGKKKEWLGREETMLFPLNPIVKVCSQDSKFGSFRRHWQVNEYILCVLNFMTHCTIWLGVFGYFIPLTFKILVFTLK